jgi:hypothetical protein
MVEFAVCPKCNNQNPPTAEYCHRCASPLPGAKPRESRLGHDFSAQDRTAHPALFWNWIGIGAGILVAGMLLVGLIIVPALVGKYLLTLYPQPALFWVFYFLVGAPVYLVGSGAIGRLSWGYTVREAVIAALAASAVSVALLPVLNGAVHFDGLGIGAGVAVVVLNGVLGALGGTFGERLQTKAREDRRK